jgi:hypothetical protein
MCVDEVGAQHFGEVSIDDGWDGVEFRDESVLDPVDDPLPPEDHEGHPPGLGQPLPRERQADVGQILNDDHEQEHGQLETLNDVTRADLHQIVMVETLEHRALQFDEIVAHENNEQR